MGEDEIKQITVGGINWDAVRVTDGTGRGYIELRIPGSAEMAARVTYHGPDRDMDIETNGRPVPRLVITELFERADRDLA